MNKQELLNKIKNNNIMTGYREENILKNIKNIKKSSSFGSHVVYYVFDLQNNYFIVDFTSNNIIG